MVPLEPNNADIKTRLYQYVPYIGLYLFGIGATVMYFLEISSCIQCTVIANRYLREHVLTDITDLVYNHSVFAALNLVKAISIIFQVSITPTN